MSQPNSNQFCKVAPAASRTVQRWRVDGFVEDKIDDKWDEFLTKLTRAHHQQTSRWARIKRSEGWRSLRIICEDEQDIVGGAQLLFHRVRPHGVVGYVQKGPCIADGRSDLSEAAIEQLIAAARKVGVSYLAIELPDAGNSLIAECASAGMWPKPARLPPVAMMEATSLVDLSFTESELLARMRSSTRRNIRQGIQRGVIVREGAEKDLNTFFDLMLATARRRGEPPNPPDVGYFRRVWQEFHPIGWLRLTIAEYDGEPVSGELAVPFSDTHRLWKFGWSGRYRERNPSDVLCWDSISWAKRRGFKKLDLVQVDPVVADANSDGRSTDPEIMARRLYGPTMHKMGFGGQVTRLPGTYCIFLHPMFKALNPAFRNPLLRQVSSGLAGAFAGLAWRRSETS